MKRNPFAYVLAWIGVLTAPMLVIGSMVWWLSPPASAQFDAVPAVTRLLPHWVIAHDPAVNVQATATRAASTTGGVHVADCLTATVAAGTVAPAAVNVTVVLRDGATGAGTVLWSADFAIAGAIADHPAPIALCGLSIAGTANTAMTVEFTGAGGANTFETVGLTGYDRAPFTP